MDSLSDKQASVQQTPHEKPDALGPGQYREHVNLSKDLTSRVTPFLVFFSLWISFAGWIINFDIGYTGTVYQMQPFNKAFGRCAMVPASTLPGAPPSAQGLVEFCSLSATAQSVGGSVHILFMGLGAFLSGITGRYLGRRGALQLASLIVAIGAAGMLGTAGNYTAYVVCKCIGGIGIGQMQTIGPLYGVEVTPSSRRGFLVALFVIGQGLGNLVVACVCLGSSPLQNNWSWKSPIACQIPVSALFAVVLLVFPESPRWLLLHGKEDKARKSFARFYNKDPNSQEIIAQVREVQAVIEAEALIASTTHWTEIFHRNNIRRTLTATYPTTAASLSGGLAIFTYAAIFLSGVGVKNPFVVNVILNVCLVSGTFIGPFVVEFLGRRWSTMTGYGCMSVCMLIFAVVSSTLGDNSSIAHEVVVAFLCIWTFFFGGFIASSQWLASAEMHSVRLRTYGQAFVITVNDIFQFASNFWTPYMINAQYGNWGTNVGYFYFGLELALLAGFFLIVPENARLTLEQIDDFFESGGKAWTTSIFKNKATARQQNSQVLNDE